MKTLILLLAMLFTGMQASANADYAARCRKLQYLYAQINDGLILKDFNLLIYASTDKRADEGLWNTLAQSRSRGLNVIMVYDGGRQDTRVIAENKKTKAFHSFHDVYRRLPYCFNRLELNQAALIGPKGHVLFEGVLSSQNIPLIEKLVTTK